MSSMFGSNTQALISGGTFTQVFNDDGHYHRYRRAALSQKFLCETHRFLNL